MYKRMILILMVLAISILIADYFKTIFSIEGKYTLSVIILLLGMLCYPFECKDVKIKYMFLPIIVVGIFNVINIIVLKNISSELIYINIVFAAFSLIQRDKVNYASRNNN